MTIDIQALRQAVVRAKRKKPQHIIFTRLGDFWEAFDEDAQVVARALGRGVSKYDGMVIYGIPYHAIDEAITTLESKGYCVELLSMKETGR